MASFHAEVLADVIKRRRSTMPARRQKENIFESQNVALRRLTKDRTTSVGQTVI